MGGMARSRTKRSVGTTIAVIAGASVVALAATAAIAAAVVTVVFARVVITPSKKREEDLRVFDVGDETITLSATPDSLLPGRYGLFFGGDTGYARVGEIISSDKHRVTRELIAVDRGIMHDATRARWSSWYFETPVQLGVEFRSVDVQTELGPAPAWLIESAEPSDNWVINVHGRGVTRSETVRAVPVFADAGFTSLLMSYRNDGVAPASGDGRYALGAKEWHDVEAALDFAIDMGAKNFVLMGWSMGGATVLQAALRSQHRALIRGIVLDSPVVDWRGVLDFQAGALRLPRAIRQGVLEVLGTKWGGSLTGQTDPIDLDTLDIVRRAAELEVPILLLHSVDDGYVPADSSKALSLLRPDLVTFEEFHVARHVKLWNYDPERWTNAIAEFVDRVMQVKATTARKGTRTRRATTA
jgi:uncharacterized protein